MGRDQLVRKEREVNQVLPGCETWFSLLLVSAESNVGAFSWVFTTSQGIWVPSSYLYQGWAIHSLLFLPCPRLLF